MDSKVLAWLCDPGTGPDYGTHLESLCPLLSYFFVVWHLPCGGWQFPPRGSHQLLTVEPAGIMGFCSETRILAQAAKDGKVPAHEVRCYPRIQFFPCRQGKGVFSQMQTMGVKVA